MKVRFKGKQNEYYSNKFNIHSISEVFIFDNESIDTVFIKDLEVLLPTGWKDMAQTFKNKELISDNCNERFREPQTQEEKEKGYYE